MISDFTWSELVLEFWELIRNLIFDLLVSDLPTSLILNIPNKYNITRDHCILGQDKAFSMTMSMTNTII